MPFQSCRRQRQRRCRLRAAAIISRYCHIIAAASITLSAAATTPHYAAICWRHCAFQYAYADFRHALAMMMPAAASIFTPPRQPRMPPASMAGRCLYCRRQRHTPRFRMPAFRRRFRQNYAASCCIR
jgi:hypothetical protein